MQRIRQLWPSIKNVVLLLLFFSAGVVYASPSSQAITSPPLVGFSTESLQTIVIGPLEFQVDGKKRSSVLLLLVAAALYLPNGANWLIRTLKSNGPSEKDVLPAQSTSVETNTTFSFNQQIFSSTVKPDESIGQDYFSAGVNFGSKSAFLTVVNQMVTKIRNEAGSLKAGFTEESDAAKYRKSKLNRLTEFCSSLDSALEEQWFLQACEIYNGSFSEKRAILDRHSKTLATIKKKQFLLSTEYDRFIKEGDACTSHDEYEEQFRMIYQHLIDELDLLCDALRDLIGKCAAEVSQPIATQAMCDAKSRIASRRVS